MFAAPKPFDAPVGTVLVMMLAVASANAADAPGGYNWQSGASGTFAGYQFSNPWFGTLRGRAGYVINNVFLYGTAGLALGISTVASGGLSDSSGHLGWTIGAGAEFGLAPLGLSPNWSAKVEYLYLGLSQGPVLSASVPSNFQSNVLRFGVNYHF